MGAPKQKWRPEEERALKAGVSKHGIGKWRTILSDPEFTSVLKSRSNVDLKDKWRNINVTAVGGSRKKAKIALKKTPSSSSSAKAKANTALCLTNGADGGKQILATPTLATSSEPPRPCQDTFASVDKIIIETITNLKEPFGPDGNSILMYIQTHFKKRPDMKRLVNSRLRHLTRAGTLLKLNQKYKISQSYMAEAARQRSPLLLLEGNKENSPKPEENGVKDLTTQVDEEFMKKEITEASAFTAAAVAEADFAVGEAQEATRMVEEVEAEVEANLILTKAAMKFLKTLRMK